MIWVFKRKNTQFTTDLPFLVIFQKTLLVFGPNCLRKTFKHLEDDRDVYVNRLVEDQLPQAITRKMMKLATAEDKELRLVLEDIGSGVCRNGLTRYTNVFPELSEVEGIVMRGDQIVIPRELQAMAVHLAHEGHLGQDKTLGLLRETCWFPGMGDMVHKLVSTCRPCLFSHSNSSLSYLRVFCEVAGRATMAGRMSCGQLQITFF